MGHGIVIASKLYSRFENEAGGAEHEEVCSCGLTCFVLHCRPWMQDEAVDYIILAS